MSKDKPPRTIEDDAKRFLGKPPYNTASNICAGDGYYSNDCRRHWGEDRWRKAVRAEEEK